MILAKFLDSRVREVKRNLEHVESKIKEVRLFDDFDLRSVRIRKNLPIDFKRKLIELLKKHRECFAWFIANMSRIGPEVACHKLAIDPNVKLV